jgi:hypothetical protein
MTQMESIRRFGDQLNTRHLILVVVIWWLAMLVIYAIITLRVNHHKGELREKGVQITNEFAKLVSLSLLEKNSQSISKLLTDAVNRPDVIYVSVVDHRNTVVAFTGTGHLMPDRTEAVRSIEQVALWEGGFASHARILNFVSDITYAGTKIGEIFIGLSTPKTVQIRKQFMWFAVLSCLIVLFLAAVFRYQTIKALLLNYLNLIPSKATIDPVAHQKPIVCPLCGTPHSMSRKLFNRKGLDQFLKIKDVKPVSNPEGEADSKGPDQPQTDGNRDFSKVKRQIILRCTEIIKKLTA